MSVCLGAARAGLRNASVRVQCEAIDCGALLEVEVPHEHTSNTPLIVRCGNCQRLLEVWLHMPCPEAGGEPVSDAPSGPLYAPGQTTPAAVSAGSKQIPPSLVDQSGMLGNGYTPQLIKPPPLSRSSFSYNAAAAVAAAGQHVQYSAQGEARGLLPPITSILGSLGVQGDVSAVGFGDHPAVQPVSVGGKAGGLAGLLAQGQGTSMEAVGGDLDVFKDEELGSGGKVRKVRKVRNPSPYNVFMSEEVKRIKAEQPSVDHKQAFRMAARHWAKSPHDCRKLASLRSITNQEEDGAPPQQVAPLGTLPMASAAVGQGTSPAPAVTNEILSMQMRAKSATMGGHVSLPEPRMAPPELGGPQANVLMDPRAVAIGMSSPFPQLDPLHPTNSAQFEPESLHQFPGPVCEPHLPEPGMALPSTVDASPAVDVIGLNMPDLSPRSVMSVKHGKL